MDWLSQECRLLINEVHKDTQGDEVLTAKAANRHVGFHGYNMIT